MRQRNKELILFQALSMVLFLIAGQWSDPCLGAEAPGASAQDAPSTNSGKEQTTKEQTAKERTAKEQAAKEQTAKEQTAKEQTAKGQATKEHAPKGHVAKVQPAKGAANPTAARAQAAADAAKSATVTTTTSNAQAAKGYFQKQRARREFVQQLNDPDHKFNNGLSYWIELTRAGKVYRCNNKVKFKSGDEIRFHVVTNADGFAYILLKKGSSGGHRLLFPDEETGIDNHILKGHDYVIPTEAALAFDNQKGAEIVGLLFSRTKLSPEQYMNIPTLTCFVSAREDGSKDLVPTRMQLSWDDPDPVIIPGEVTSGGAPQVVSFSADQDMKVDINSSRQDLRVHLKDKSFVYVVDSNPDAILSLEVALQHD
jgi:hypothetical protein